MHGLLSEQAAFGTIFRVTGGYQKAGASFGRIFTISDKQKLYFRFSS
jgi:hypothetical protein